MISQLRDALSVLTAVLTEAIHSSDLAYADSDAGEPSEFFRDAYLLSRGLAFHDVSLLVVHSYQQINGHQEKKSDSLTARRSMLRHIHRRLDDAIRELDRMVDEGIEDKPDPRVTEGSNEADRSDDEIVPFDPRTLETLINWELSASVTCREFQVEVNAALTRSFSYSPIAIASVLSRTIQIIGTGKQDRFVVSIENRGLSIVVCTPLVKSSLVEILLDSTCDLYFLKQLTESSGICLIVDEVGLRLVMPLRMPERQLLNIDYDVLAAVVRNPFTSKLLDTNE